MSFESIPHVRHCAYADDSEVKGNGAEAAVRSWLRSRAMRSNTRRSALRSAEFTAIEGQTYRDPGELLDCVAVPDGQVRFGVTGLTTTIQGVGPLDEASGC